MGTFFQTLSPDQWFEISFILLMIVILWCGNSKKLIRRFSLQARLRISGVFLFCLGIFGFLFNRQLTDFEFFSNFEDTMSINIFLYEGVIFGLLLMLLVFIKSIIFHQQTQYTTTVFRLLLIAFLLKLTTFVSAPFSINYDVEPFFSSDALFDVLFGITVVIFYFIGLRCKWIHSLNKSQKFSTFFWGIVFASFAFPLLFKLMNGLEGYSLIMSQFLRGVIQFVVIYSGLCLLSLLVFLPSAGFLDKKSKELKMLQQLSNALSTILNEEKLFDEAVKLCSHMVEAQYVWLEIKEGQEFRLESVYGIKENEIRGLPLSCVEKLRHLILNHEMTLFIPDLNIDRALKSIRKWLPRSGALLGSKIGNPEDPQYLLYAVHRNRFGFTDSQARMLQTMGEQISGALDNSRLLSQTIEQKVYKEELKMAHEAQMRLLPKFFPDLPGAKLNGFCSTANDIGGDFYDVIQVDDDRIDILIGDVSGKGADAAFYMAELKGMLQPLAMHHQYPKDILAELNQILYTHFEANTFVTMIYASYSIKSKKLRFVRAGHPPMILVRNNKNQSFMTKGLGLGLVSNDPFENQIEQKIIQLKKKDCVFLYTDGLIEARDTEDDEYGEERLNQLFLSVSEQNIQDPLVLIRSRINVFTEGSPQTDDITVLLLNIQG